MNGFNRQDSPKSQIQHCCLIDDGKRCRRSASNACYHKRIMKQSLQKQLKLDIDETVGHIYICEHHKNFIQSFRVKRKRKESELRTREEISMVDFNTMPMNMLKRYRRHYKLPIKQGINKFQLAESVNRHFRSIRVNEKEALAFFIYSAKNK